MTTIETTTSPTATDHTATVGQIYAAFGRGDVPFIMSKLADDVAWDQGVRSTSIPWIQPGHGADHVLAFFQALGGGLAFSVFEPQTIAQQGDTVVSVVREVGTATSTGKAIDEDLWVHVWRFGADGKVTSFRHIGDFARHEAALT